MKRIISMTLVLMLLISCLAGVAVSAEDTSYTAKLGYASTDWSAQEWGDNANTTVTGAGDYSVSWNGAGSDAGVFVVDIAGAGADFAAKDLRVTALSVLVDGVELPVDLTKVVTGDLESNGNFRIEIYNQYGSTKDNAPVDPAAVKFATNLTVNFTISGPKEYTAKLGYASTDWSAQEWGDNANTTVTGAGDYSVSWNGAGPDAGVFVVDIAGAGADFAAKDLRVTALSVLVDGVAIPVDLAKIVTGDLESNGNFRIEIYNQYGSTKDNAPVDPAAVKFATNLTVNFTLGAAEVEGPEFDLFIAYGGDREATNDWGYEYYGADTDKSAGITSVTESIRVGETKTISLTFDNAAVYSWFFAPCLVAEDISWIGELDFDIICKVNGQEVAINMEADSQGRTWWTEGTGDYDGTQCIRLAGGYNEWGAQFIAQPEGLTTLEYTITLNGVEEAPEPGEETESKDEYLLFLGYGGDKVAENDWGWSYGGEETPAEGITAVTATVKSGDTATISLTFAGGTVNSWWFAPTLVGTSAGNLISTVDMDIVCKIDGVEVPVDMAADAEGKVFWSEGTGNYKAEDCVRLAGGYNEWATQYIAEPGAFTTIEYTITFNSIKVTEPVEETPTIVEIDKMGKYNAYLMLQTPGWTFRNAHDDAFYGMNGSSWEALGLTWGQYLVHQDHPGETWGKISDTEIAGNGTYSVSITDFGTVFADDFANNGQDYFNIIAISTDLPAGANVTITDVKLIIDGQVRHTYAEAYINAESGSSLQILLQNIWNADVKEISYYPAPSESLEIQFTISGFDYDKAVEEVPTEPTQPDVDEPGDSTEEPVSIVAWIKNLIVVILNWLRNLFGF